MVITFTSNFFISMRRASEKAIQARFDMEYAAKAGSVNRPEGKNEKKINQRIESLENEICVTVTVKTGVPVE